MKICIVTHALECGGMETSIMRLAKIGMELGHEVSVLTTEHQGVWFEKFNEVGINTQHAGRHPLGALFQVFRIAGILRQLRSELVILFHARYAQAGLGMLEDHVVVAPSIRLHDESFYDVALGNHRNWGVILCNSPALMKEAKWRAPGRKVVCIMNSVDVAADIIMDDRATKFTPIKILFVGRLVEHKGVRLLPDIIIECLRLNLNVELTVIGDGNLMDWLRSAIKEKGITRKIKLLGTLRPAEVSSKYIESHILLLPTYAEGMPNVILEALAHGCVPIATELEGITDCLVRNGKTGFLVKKGAVAEFACAIRRLADDSGMWNNFSTSGVNDVVKNHSLESMKQAYASFFSDVQDNHFNKPRRGWLRLPICFSLLRPKDLIPPYVKEMLRPYRRRIPAILGGLPPVRR